MCLTNKTNLSKVKLINSISCELLNILKTNFILN